MKHSLKYIFLPLLFLIISSGGITQDCRHYHQKRSCIRYSLKYFDNGFNIYGQSRGILMTKGQTTKYSLVLYGKKDYVINMCAKEKLFPIHYRIIDADTKEVFYDNEEDDYVEQVGFSNEQTRKIILEVTMLAEKFKPKDMLDSRACVGILILWRKMPKTGFTKDEELD